VTGSDIKAKDIKAKAKTPEKARKPRRSAKSRANEALARGYFEAMAARDTTRMLDHWSPEGIDELVPLTVLRGHAEIREYFDGLFAAVPDLDVTAQRVVSDDNSAVVEWRLEGTFAGAPFQGIEPTGRPVEMRGLDVLDIEDGKVVRNTGYYDGAAFVRQVGMLPAQDSGAERAMKGAFNAVTRVRKAVNERMSG
jgi:steroid delta-isomerase-like uncharacterized protein